MSNWTIEILALLAVVTYLAAMVATTAVSGSSGLEMFLGRSQQFLENAFMVLLVKSQERFEEFVIIIFQNFEKFSFLVAQIAVILGFVFIRNEMIVMTAAIFKEAKEACSIIISSVWDLLNSPGKFIGNFLLLYLVAIAIMLVRNKPELLTGVEKGQETA